MYLKRVNGHCYFCMSVRKNGHVSTVYLGQTQSEAEDRARLLREELGIGARGRPRKNDANPRFCNGKKSQARPLIIVSSAVMLFCAILLLNAQITGNIVADFPESASQNLSPNLPTGSIADLELAEGILHVENSATSQDSGQSGATASNIAPSDNANAPEFSGSSEPSAAENNSENISGNATNYEGQENPGELNVSPDVSEDTEDARLATMKTETESRLGVRMESLKKKGKKFDLELTRDGARIKLGGVNPVDLTEVRTARFTHASLGEKKIRLNTETIELNSVPMGTAEITLNKTGPVNAILKCMEFSSGGPECISWERTGIPFTDNGGTITFNVSGFSGYAGAYITIINVQSYPTVGGEWTVEFTAEGEADLAISASNGTAYGTEPPADLEWLSLRCGSQTLSPEFDGTSVFFANWSCEETGFQTVRVLTEGAHTQQFVLGDDIQYAHNWAKAGNVYNCSSCSDCNDAIANASSGDVVQLNASITNQVGTCISFGGKDNVTFDCMGNTIDGDDTDTDYGIWLNESSGGSNNDTIRNCIVRDFYHGIFLNYSSYVTFYNCTSTSNTYHGIFLTNGSSSNNFTVISITGNTQYGFTTEGQSNNNNFSNFTVSGNLIQMRLYSKGNLLNGVNVAAGSGIQINGANNTLRNTTIALASGGTGLSVSGSPANRNDIDGSNTINGKPVQYFDGYFKPCPNNQVLDYNNTYSQIALVDCTNVTLYATTMTDSVYILYTKNSTFRNINSSNSDSGIVMSSADNNRLYNITVLNDDYGFEMGGNSINNTFVNITAAYNTRGFSMQYAYNNSFSYVNATTNNYGFYLFYDSDGNNVTNSRIERNSISGIYFFASATFFPEYNLFINNYFNNSANVYSNNESNLNYWNATLDCSSGPNIIGGPCIGGNLWTSPAGNFSDSCADVDQNGICDAAYAPAINNTDYLPLRGPRTSTCGSCQECNDIISNAGLWDVIQLNASLINQVGSCVNFNGKSNITFDCMGYAIDGDDSGTYETGILLNRSGGSGSNNNVVRNCNVTDFYYGIYVLSSSGNSIINSSSKSNYYDGFRLYNSTNNTLVNLTANSNGYYGIYLYSGANNNTLSNFTLFANSYYGLYVYTSSGNVITNGNSSESNRYAIYFYISSDSDCNNVITNVTGSAGRPVMFANYSANLSGATYSDLALCNADGSNISNVTVRGSSTLRNGGIIAFRTSYASFSGINSSSGYMGIYLDTSSNNSFDNITADSNYLYGMQMYNSGNLTVSNSMFRENSQYDVYIGSAYDYNCNNLFSNVTVSGPYPLGYFNYSANVTNTSFSELLICNADNASFYNVTVRGSLNISNNGVIGYRTDWASFDRINSSRNYNGIILNYCSNSTFVNSVTNSNSNHGIYLAGSNYANLFANGTSNYNTNYGMYLYSTNNTILNFSATRNTRGIYIYASSQNNSISRSTIWNNSGYGIYLANSGSSFPILNRIFDNVLNNTVNLYTNNESNVNGWNSTYDCSSGPNIIGGPCIGGNMWTSPSGNFSDSCADGNYDLICDGNYTPTLNNTDFLPLTFDRFAPGIIFVSPTDANNSVVGRTWTSMNVSVLDGSNTSSFLDWNRSLAGWWSMDFYNSSGVYDNSSWGLFGQFQGSLGTANITAGRIGNALKFDGVDDILFVQGVPNLNPVTFSMWVKPQDFSSARRIFDRGGGTPIVGIETNGKVGFWGSTSIMSDSAITLGDWHYVAAIGNSSGHYLYVDGRLSSPASVPYDLATNPLSIGGAVGSFLGAIDDFRVFGRSLSPEEINASYNAGLYGLSHNFTNLTDGIYTFRAYAQDAAGNVNQTGQMTLTVDLTDPSISFADPTDGDNSNFNRVWSYVNASTADANPGSMLADWNRSLAGWWRFNAESGENSTFFRDWSTWGNNGTCDSEAGYCPSYNESGKFGKALDFDGINDTLGIGDINSTDNASYLTVSAWINAKSLNVSRSIVSKYYAGENNWVLGISDTSPNDVYFGPGNTWAAGRTTNGIIQTGGWEHVAAVFDGTQASDATRLRIYINGVKQNLTFSNPPIPATSGNNSRPIRIGSDSDMDPCCMWNGEIDDVQIWNRPLTEGEIKASFNAGLYGLSSNYTSLNEGSQSYTVYSQDLAGNHDSTSRTVTVDLTRPNVQFTPPTPEAGEGRSFRFDINATIEELYLGNLTYSWNGTNHSLYDDSLVLLMNMDNVSSIGENDSVAIDVSRSRATGFVQGSAKHVESEHGNAFQFDESTGDYIRINSTPSLDINGSHMTIAFWFNATWVGYDDGLIDKAWYPDNMTIPYYQYGVERGNSSGKFDFLYAIPDGSTFDVCSSDPFFVPGRWWHGAFVFNGSEGVWYINGARNASCFMSYPITPRGNTNVNLGADAAGNQGLTGMLDEVMIFNRSLSAEEVSYIYSGGLRKLSEDQWQLRLTQTNLSTGKIYNYYLYASDISGNSNTTGQRTIVGNVKPGFVSMNRSPSGDDEMDPNITLAISVNVSDTDNNLDSVILQWKNASAGWSQAVNVTMQNSTSKSFFTGYSASFTPAYESNFTYLIWANDTEGEWNTSVPINISVFYDWTWTVDRSGLGATVAGGFGNTREAGSFMINNTADFNMSFSISDNSPYDPSGYPKGCGLLYNGSCYVALDPISSNQSSKGVKFYSVNATFGVTTREDPVTITILAVPAVNASPQSRTVNFSLATYGGGPYLDVHIDVFPPALNQSDTGMLSAFVKNIGNETAQAVSAAWSIPAPFTSSGNVVETPGNMSPGIQDRYNLNVTPDASKATVGSYSLSFNASGGGSNGTSDSDSISISVYCSQSDGVCGSGCTYLSTSSVYDLDCKEPAPTVVTQGGVVTAAQAAAGLPEWQKQKLFQTEETYEIVRSNQQEFALKVENPFEGTLDNVSVEVSGFLKQYISVSPARVSRIPRNGASEFMIRIEAPGYFAKGKYELNFTITGVIVSQTSVSANSSVRRLTPVREHRIVTLIIHEISREEAEKYLNDSREIITLMKGNDLYSADLDAELSRAIESFAARDFELSREIYQNARDSKDAGLQTLSVLAEVENRTLNAITNGISVPRTERLVMLSRAALVRGDFATALQRANDAKFTYALESFGVFNLAAYVINNWPMLSAATIIIIVMGSLGILSVKFRLLSRRLVVLKKEEDVLLGLIKELQNDCFERGKLGMKEYFESLLQYDKKMSSVVQEIVRLDIQKANMLKLLSGEHERLLEERRKLLGLIKATQSMYLEAGNLDTRVYENKMRSYAERIAEIEERIADLEAKKAVKRNFWSR